MIQVALKGLAGRKLRSALTALAIVLGIAMVSGTYILTDTMRHAFDTIFTGSLKNTDAVIRGKVAFSNDQGNGVTAPSFRDTLLGEVKKLPGVASAAGGVADTAKLVDRNGKTIGAPGAPALAFSVDTKQDQRFNPLSLVEGDWPAGPHEVAVDEGTANKEHFDVGDTIRVATRQGVRRYRVPGIVRFAGVSSFGGATIAIFDLPTAQRLFDKVGKLDEIDLSAKQGVSPSRLVREIKPILPPTAQVKSKAQQVRSDKESVSFLGVLQKALLAFAGVALFVGSFVIANTLSITIVQRTREFATLRTIGASRRQVLISVLVEALAIGIVASVGGLFLGLALAKGLNAIFKSIGIDLPDSGTVFATRTIVVSLAVGILVTVLASLRPALRATRVPPIAAVREGSVLPPSRLARFGLGIGLTVLGLGTAMVVVGAFVRGMSTAAHLLLLGVGAVAMFLGVAIFAPKLVKPLASVLAWPATQIGGAAGKLARDNAIRNPSRTAATASALMIGLALITFVAVFAQGLRGGFENAVDKLFAADYVFASTSGVPVTSEASKTLRKTPGVEVVSPIRAGSGRAFGKTINVTGVDANVDKVIAIEWKRGSGDTPKRLGLNGAFTSDKYAKDRRLRVGSPIVLETPTGRRLRLRLVGEFKPPTGGSPFGSVTISNRLFDRNYASPQDQLVGIKIHGGVSKANSQALMRRVTGFPDGKIQDRPTFVRNQEKGINKLLAVLYVLLALSILISVFGIVNTLVLTVFERTRELGMLRAVGMTRRQVRRMIRYESIVTSLIGAVLGILVGAFLGFLIAKALHSSGIIFELPVSQLAAFLLASIVIGIIAAILPARRAARLNVLEALQYE